MKKLSILSMILLTSCCAVLDADKEEKKMNQEEPVGT